MQSEGVFCSDLDAHLRCIWYWLYNSGYDLTHHIQNEIYLPLLGLFHYADGSRVWTEGCIVEAVRHVWLTKYDYTQNSSPNACM